ASSFVSSRPAHGRRQTGDDLPLMTFFSTGEPAMRTSGVSAAFILAASAAYGAGAFAENGVSANQISIGQSASLTGTAAESGQQTRDGALAYFELVNRPGGVNGRKLR